MRRIAIAENEKIGAFGSSLAKSVSTSRIEI